MCILPQVLKEHDEDTVAPIGLPAQMTWVGWTTTEATELDGGFLGARPEGA